MLEMMVVLGVVGVLAVIALPISGGAIAAFRLNGDVRSVSNQIAVAKIRAASAFSRSRLYVGIGARTFRVETWDKTTSSWIAETADVSLSGPVSFSFGAVTTPPPNTQTVIGQAPACRDNVGAVIANTACVVFNSRGVPVEPVFFAPTSDDVLYLTDGTAVHAVSVAATGMSRTWSTPPVATPTWMRN